MLQSIRAVQQGCEAVHWGVVRPPQATAHAHMCLTCAQVTKQTGPAGKPVNVLYVARKMKIAREMYFAILLDRKVRAGSGRQSGLWLTCSGCIAVARAANG